MIYMACIIQKTMYKMKRGCFFIGGVTVVITPEIKLFCQTTRKIWGGVRGIFDHTAISRKSDTTEVRISGTESAIDV